VLFESCTTCGAPICAKRAHRLEYADGESEGSAA
jgi:hypothetical protein